MRVPVGGKPVGWDVHRKERGWCSDNQEKESRELILIEDLVVDVFLVLDRTLWS